MARAGLAGCLPLAPWDTPALAPPACAAGLIEPLSLEMGEESEDELESLAAAPHGGADASPAGGAAPPGAGDELRTSRYALLRDLWATAG